MNKYEFTGDVTVFGSITLMTKPTLNLTQEDYAALQAILNAPKRRGANSVVKVPSRLLSAILRDHGNMAVALNL